MIKLIIFDFDGVIITGSNDGYFTCYHKALEDVDVYLEPTEERKRILDWWGKGHKKQLELLLQEHPDKLLEAIVAYEKCYFSPFFHEKIKLVKDADIVLKRLSETKTLAIASGMVRNTMDELIKKYNIPYFKRILTFEDAKKEEHKKPSPYMLFQLMEEFNVAKNETVYIGDAKNDVIMAKAAGIIPIVVLTGHLMKNEAEKLGVKHIIPDITHLEEILA
ncbi:MAG TPA: HAD family hydrolase [Candidatus Sulfotelmatobacter sp.]|jgi:phosphoglycolate phosphatase|nr:HAD family hydrolase [Candidatus Sulfotelmatobacter sp.]